MGISSFVAAYASFRVLLAASIIGMEGERFSGKTIFVTAHPDDEVMFFGPSLLRSDDPYVVSISQGIPDGRARSMELASVCKYLNHPNHCFSCNNSKLLDGFDNNWRQEDIITELKPFIERINPDRIVTFDDYGVSSHPNHIAVGKALSGTKNIPILHLKSRPLWLKYSGELGAVISYIFRGKSIAIVSPLSALASFRLLRAFLVHRSQVVWYRILWFLFSRFPIINLYED